MLDFHKVSLSNEKQSRTTQVRHGDSLAELIERATTVLGVEKSIFLRNAIAKEAQRVIDDSAFHMLSAEDAELFSAALDKAPEPKPRAKRAAEAYRRRIINAD